MTSTHGLRTGCNGSSDHRGVKVSWSNLMEQFGQDYGRSKDFKKAFRKALRQVCLVYPDARLHDVMGGLLLKPSHAPGASDPDS